MRPQAIIRDLLISNESQILTADHGFGVDHKIAARGKIGSKISNH